MGWPLTSGFKTFLGSTDVDRSALADGFIPYYDAASKKMKFRAATGTGDMEKATYDANNDGVVDDAAALGGTSAATITASIAAKLPLAGGTMSGAINLGNNSLFDIAQLGLIDQKTGGGGTTLYFRLNSDTAGYTKALRVDDGGSLIGAIWGEWNHGASSGMDADLLDGQQGSHYLNAGNLNAGTVPTARLGSGTANSTTFLRGDNTWQSISSGIGGSVGAVDAAIPRASGSGGATLQASDLGILTATTTGGNNVGIINNHAGQTNSTFVITPKGTGAFVLGPRPDGTLSGGNARGNFSVDLTMLHDAATKVVSGQYGFSAGRANTVSADYGCAIGNECVVSAGPGQAYNNRATAAHGGSVVFGCSTGGSGETVTSDRVNQFKVRATGGMTLVTSGGTRTDWGKLSTAPVTGIQSGDVYYDTTTNKMRCYNGTTWNDLF